MRPPFVVNPPIKTYQSNAYALGGVLALGNIASGVLDNYFICWECLPNLKDGLRPIMFLPFVSPSTFSACGFGPQLSFKPSHRDELLLSITGSLKRGFLVRLLVDEYYIPDRRSYNNRHYVHDVLITSVVPGADSFELMGYCADRRYRASTCSLAEVSEGYFGAKKIVEKSKEMGFVAFKAQLDRPISLQPGEIKRQLGCFLDSRDPHPRAEQRGAQLEERLYGLAVFTACETYVSGFSRGDWWDRRIFSLVAEHSQLMLRRTIKMERLLGVAIDKRAADEAVHLAGRLKLLSLLPEHRHSGLIFAEMGRLLRLLKEESEKAANALRLAID
jgi:hypothetical protein